MKTPIKIALKRRTFILPALAAIGLMAVAALAADPEQEAKPIVADVKPLPIMEQSAGRMLFEENCASCHGKLADGNDGKGPPLVHPYYRQNHHSDVAFYRAAEQGVQAHHWPFGNMPAQQQVSRDEVTKIIAYLRRLQNLNGIH